MTSRGLENEVIVSQLADAISRYGLRMPALVALEAGRPLAFLGAQVLWLLQPTLSLMLSANLIGQAARALERPGAVDDLIARLEVTDGPRAQDDQRS